MYLFCVLLCISLNLGSSDGVVRMWSLDYVEVAVDTVSALNVVNTTDSDQVQD